MGVTRGRHRQHRRDVGHTYPGCRDGGLRATISPYERCARLGKSRRSRLDCVSLPAPGNSKMKTTKGGLPLKHWLRTQTARNLFCLFAFVPECHGLGEEWPNCLMQPSDCRLEWASGRYRSMARRYWVFRMLLTNTAAVLRNIKTISLLLTKMVRWVG
jgi:hypothetical protein